MKWKNKKTKQNPAINQGALSSRDGPRKIGIGVI